MEAPTASSAVSISPGNGEEGVLCADADVKTLKDSLARVPWRGTWVMILSVSAVLASGLIVATHAHRGYFVATLATMVCLVSALFDAWTRRIPNALTYPAIAAGLALNALPLVLGPLHADAAVTWLGATGIGQSAIGFGVFVAVALVLSPFGVGAGDLKLFVALGALLGFWQFADVLLIAIPIAVAYALVNLLVVGRLNSVARMTAIRLLELFFLRKFERMEESAKERPWAMVPMAVPMAIGLVVAQAIDLRAMTGGGR